MTVRAAPLSCFLLPLVLACGPAVRHSGVNAVPAGTFIITAEQIERSGARTAWEVLQRSAPMLLAEDDENGRPVKLTRRGRSSFKLNDAPAVVVDDVHMPDFRNLDTVDAASINTISIVDGIEGTTYYGTNSGSGVIVIKTKNGRGS